MKHNLLLKSVTFILTAFLVQFVGIFLPSSNIIFSLDKSEEWSDDFELVEIPSPMDGVVQKAYFYKSTSAEPMPLVVSLHTWSHDFTQYDTINELCVRENINYIHPDFRGINNHADACCSDLVISDIDAAIDYALEHANVDREKIYVIGTSGGGYATLATFMKSKHSIRKFAAWVPLVDLTKWYKETSIRKLKYADEIMACTSSEKVLNEDIAREKSPIYWETPIRKLDHSEVHIYCGGYDGMLGNGTIPITHSINFYNKVLTDLGIESSQFRVSDAEKLHLLEHRSALDDFGEIGGRKVFLNKNYDNLHLTVFEGGHEILTHYAFQDLIK